MVDRRNHKNKKTKRKNYLQDKLSFDNTGNIMNLKNISRISTSPSFMFSSNQRRDTNHTILNSNDKK